MRLVFVHVLLSGCPEGRPLLIELNNELRIIYRKLCPLLEEKNENKAALFSEA